MDEQQVQNNENVEGGVTPEAQTQTATPTSAPEVQAVEQNKFLSWPIIAVLLLVVAAAGAGYFVWQGKSAVPAENTAVTKDYSDVSIVIDGNKIPNEEFTKAVAQAEQVASQQGLDPNEPSVRAQIEEQVVTILVNTQLLTLEAEKAGLTVADAKVDEQIALLETQFGGAEGLQTQLDSFGLTQEALRADLKRQLLIDAYIESTPEFAAVVVSDEEVAEAYAGYVLQNPELPPFEEISEQIKAQLLAQKQQAAVGVVIERLRADAEIESSL